MTDVSYRSVLEGPARSTPRSAGRCRSRPQKSERRSIPLQFRSLRYRAAGAPHSWSAVTRHDGLPNWRGDDDGHGLAWSARYRRSNSRRRALHCHARARENPRRAALGSAEKRDREMPGIGEWEELRSLSSAIKEHGLTQLDHYLEKFEDNARSHGVRVNRTRDDADHNWIAQGVGHGEYKG